MQECWISRIQGKSSQSTDSSILQITPHDRLYKFEHHLLPYYKLLQIIECTSLNITYYQIMTSKDRTLINNQKEKYIVQKKKMAKVQSPTHLLKHNLNKVATEKSHLSYLKIIQDKKETDGLY